MTDAMSQVTGLGLLRVGSNGGITAANRGAEQLLGRPLTGVACERVVRAADATGVRVCVDGCAEALARSEPPAVRDRCGVVVRGRPARLRCERVGDEVVVALSWGPAVHAVELLSSREREVLRWVAEGLTDRAVAARLGIRASTVRTHVEHARAKLGARTRAHAIVRAIATGQLSSREPVA